MQEASMRDVLQALTEEPLGSPHLQSEAERTCWSISIHPSAQLQEVCKRVSKIWLPQGRKSPKKSAACNEPSAVQIDIEDTIERLGGKRGSHP